MTNRTASRFGHGALALLACISLASLTAAAEPYVPRCNIGKPSYCLKYAQMFCVKTNARSDREKSCAAWEEACLKCHARIPACFAGPRPLLKSDRCRTCDNEWRDCMHSIDKKFWPNRRKKD